jgi:hypothetical protein
MILPFRGNVVPATGHSDQCGWSRHGFLVDGTPYDHQTLPPFSNRRKEALNYMSD